MSGMTSLFWIPSQRQKQKENKGLIVRSAKLIAARLIERSAIATEIFLQVPLG